MNGSSNSSGNSGGFSRPNNASPNIYRHHRLHPCLADILAAVAVETGSACPARLREQIVERGGYWWPGRGE